MDVKHMKADPSFKVVIVGGSIAALTLAHCLCRAGIHHVILEKREEVAPQEGASIGIMPNGARILDQLGLYGGIEELVHPLETAHVTYPDLFCYSSQYPRLLRERFGYPLAFLDRQKVLAHLASSLPPQSELQLGKEVDNIQPMGDRVRIHCRDGSYFDGDLVVGADGVHSRVRREMWQLAKGVQDSKFSSIDKKKMGVEYACVFGISKPHPRLSPGLQISCYNNGWSILSVVGQNSRTYWFLFLKLGRKYAYGEAPRFSAQDAMKRCEALRSEPFWKDVSFGDLWSRRETFNMTNLEEYVLDNWHWGRIVCLGDSVHKIAPHIGQGANCAMEDASVLCNALQQLLSSQQTPSTQELDGLLHTFTAGRRARMDKIAHTAKFAMRLHARDGWLIRLLGRYYLPYTGDMPADRASRSIADGEMLAFCPEPQRSGPGWTRYRTQKGFKQSVLAVGISIVLILGMGFQCWYKF